MEWEWNKHKMIANGWREVCILSILFISLAARVNNKQNL